MPTTPDYARASELEVEIKHLLLAAFDAYGDEAKLAELQRKLAIARRELSMLRTPQLEEAA